MKNVEIWTGLPGSGRKKAAIEEALTAITKQGSRVLWVVNSKSSARRLEREFLEASGGVLVGLDLVVAGRLAWQVVNDYAWQIDTVDVEERDILFAELSGKILRKYNLPINNSDGWIKEVKKIYIEYKTELKHQASAYLQKVNRYYPWIKELIDSYESTLAAKGKIDESDLVEIAGELIEKKRTTLHDLVVIDRLGPLNPKLLILLETLVNKVNSSRILIDYSQNAGPALSLSKTDYHRWQKIEGVRQRAFALEKENEKLAETLYANLNEVDTEERIKTPFLNFYLDKTEELMDLARLISELVHEKGVPPSDIHVACTDLQNYLPIIEDVFPNYGLSFSHGIGESFEKTSLGYLIKTLLDIRVNGFERDKVRHLLSNPLFSGPGKLRGKESVLLFDSEAKKARIHGWSKDINEAWLKPLKELALSYLAEAKTISNVEAQKRTLYKAEWIKGVSKDFVSLHRTINRLSDRCSSDELEEWFGEIFEEYGVRKKIFGLDGNANKQKVEREALNHLPVLFKHLSNALLMVGSKETSVSRVAEILEKLIKNSTISPQKHQNSGVEISGPLEIRGRRASHMFFIGLTANNWPKKPDRSIVEPFGKSDFEHKDLLEGRALTFEILASNDQVYFSTPCPSEGENDDVLSPLIEELRDSAIQFISNKSDRTVLLSRAEILKRMGEFGSESITPKTLEAFIREAESKDSDKSYDWRNIFDVLEIERQRNNPALINEYSGKLFGKKVCTLWQNSEATPILSATRLDCYAQCPMKYLFRNLLQVEAVDELKDEMEPMFLGNLVHEILADVGRDLAEKGLGFDSDYRVAKGLMLKYAEVHIKKREADNLLYKQQINKVISGLENEGEKAGYLAALLQHKKIKKFMAGLPVMVEVPFGMKEADDNVLLEEPLEINYEKEKILFRGQIDLISHTEKKGWKIWDYKTTSSNPPTKGSVINGLSYQLFVYMLAMEKYLRDFSEKDQNLDEAGYLHIKKNGEIKQTGFWSKKLHEEYKPQLLSSLASISRAMNNNYYNQPMSQSSSLCQDGNENRCPYRRVCRRNNELFKRREKEMNLKDLEQAHVLPLQKLIIERMEGEDR